jgi:hypothetical protein
MVIGSVLTCKEVRGVCEIGEPDSGNSKELLEYVCCMLLVVGG